MPKNNNNNKEEEEQILNLSMLCVIWISYDTKYEKEINMFFAQKYGTAYVDNNFFI